MNKRRGFHRFQKKDSSRDNGLYESLNIFLPKEQFDYLRDLSDERQLPISRLISFAVDNELDQTIPFKYDILEPTTEFVEDAYIEEAGKIMRFMQHFPGGIGRDSLMLFRRTIGVPNKTVFMLALRELFKAGMVIKTARKPAFNKFDYGPLYEFIKLSSDVPNPTALQREKAQIEEAERKLAARKARLDKNVTKIGGKNE